MKRRDTKERGNEGGEMGRKTFNFCNRLFLMQAKALKKPREQQVRAIQRFDRHRKKEISALKRQNRSAIVQVEQQHRQEISQLLAHQKKNLEQINKRQQDATTQLQLKQGQDTQAFQQSFNKIEDKRQKALASSQKKSKGGQSTLNTVRSYLLSKQLQEQRMLQEFEHLKDHLEGVHTLESTHLQKVHDTQVMDLTTLHREQLRHLNEIQKLKYDLAMQVTRTLVWDCSLPVGGAEHIIEFSIMSFSFEEGRERQSQSQRQRKTDRDKRSGATETENREREDETVWGCVCMRRNLLNNCTPCHYNSA